MDPRQLREATRAEHEATEALMPLMGQELTRGGYIAVLQTLYPLLQDWEGWAARAAPEKLRNMLPRRRRNHLLLQDLAALGAQPAVERQIFVDWNAVVSGASGAREAAPDPVAGFLGAMYVMEGSTLGGRFIARHVETALGLEPGVGDAYFRGHEEATGAMWREVLEHIAAVPEESAPVVIGAARRAFGAFGEAMRAGLLSAGTLYT